MFLHVTHHSSITNAAAAAQVPQPVASRRLQALERHLGGTLLHRSRHRTTLTPLGRRLLPSIERLVDAAENLDLRAAQNRDRPVTIALPDFCTPLQLARLMAADAGPGIGIELAAAPPARRAEVLRAGSVDAALIPAPPDVAEYVVPLGVAAVAHEAPVFRLDSLRPHRGESDPRRLWVQPEDQVPLIRGPLGSAATAVGLLPSQLVTAADRVSAIGAALKARDVLLCSRTEAAELALAWVPLAGVDLRRAYVLYRSHDDAEIPSAIDAGLGECLGIESTRAPWDGGR